MILSYRRHWVCASNSAFYQISNNSSIKSDSPHPLPVIALVSEDFASWFSCC